MKNTFTLIIALFGTISTLFAQTNKPTLVKDINTASSFPETATRSSFPQGFSQLNNSVYFKAEPDLNDLNGDNLYSMANGTAIPQLIPLNLGERGFAGQQKAHLMLNSLFLVVRRNDTIYDLWKSDGATATFVDTLSRFGTHPYNTAIGTVYGDKLYVKEEYTDAFAGRIANLIRHSGVQGSKQFVAKIYRQNTLPSGFFFSSISEEVKNYYPTPDVTFMDVTVDSFNVTASLRGRRRIMRAFDHTNGALTDLFSINWRGDYGESTDRFTNYKVIGAVNSKLLFTSRTSLSYELLRDTIFSLDKTGVKTIVQINAGSPVKAINLGNRIIYLDVFSQIWETDGTPIGTRLLLPSTPSTISDMFYANGQIYYWLQTYLPNNRYANTIKVVGGGEIGRFETTTQSSSGPVFWNDNKDLFVSAEMAQGDTINKKIFKVEISATPLRDLGLISRCRLGSYANLDSLCPCLTVPLGGRLPEFTTIDSTLIFVAWSEAYGQEVWRMNLGRVTQPNPCATDTTKPVFTNCPINITTSTSTICANVSWVTPIATDNCSTPSVSATHATTFCFPIGTTTVVYTATDARNNRATCSFTVTITGTTAANCQKYAASQTNSICNPASYQPFFLRNTTDLFVPDGVEFKETSAGTATLKGILRTATWQAVPIDLTFSGKNTTGTPALINCLTPSVSTANWAYYPTVSGTITLPTGVIVVNSATNALQIGTSANTQNVGELGGYAKIGNATTAFDVSFKLSNPVNINCEGGVVMPCATDTIAPVLSGIPANVTTDCFTTVPTAAVATATDNCTANVRIQFQEVRGADFLLRTWTAIDTRGNASTGTQRITILDRNPPVISNCPATLNASTTATCTTVTWTPPTATDVCGTPTLLPNLPVNTCFSIGTTPVIYTATDVAGNSSTCRFNVIVTNGTMSSGLDVSIVATPSEYRFWTPINYRISLKNNGLTTSNGIKIVFEPADLQSGGGAVTASVGTFNEYCSGGIACREWTIPSLAAGATATLDVPRFVLNPVGNLVSKARLLTPSISEATVTVTSAANALNGGSARLSRPKSTQLVPVIIQYISPNPTLGDLEIELESLTERDVVFQFSDLIGNVVQTQTRRLVAGFQIKTFDVSSLPQGVYFIQISTNRARNVPVKFVKM